ncbi:MAG: hypothetical protein AAF466_14340, partial [Bacteroidota bacterium]
MFTIAVLLIMQIESFFLQSGYMFQFPKLFMVSVPFIFTLGPLSWLYYKDQMNLGKSKWDALHFLPFIFFFLYSFNFYLQNDAFKSAIYLYEFRNDISVPLEAPSFNVDPW